MSGTTSPATKTDLTNAAVKAAQDLPDLLAKLKAVDAPLADQIEGKSLLASKTPWGVLASTGVAWVASRYGLNWDETTSDLVAGAALLLGAYVMRWVSNIPVTGLFAKKAVPVPTGPIVISAKAPDATPGSRAATP